MFDSWRRAYPQANCCKRALLIWLSTLVFGNPVGIYNGLGTLILISGVMAYNYVKQKDPRKKGGLPIRLKKTKSQAGTKKKLLLRV